MQVKRKLVKTDVTDIGVNKFGENNNLLAFGQIFGKITMYAAIMFCIVYLCFNSIMMVER